MQTLRNISNLQVFPLQFSALVRNEMVQSLSCYYEPKRKQFYSVIQLGTDICGYKRIVHGGPLTAV